MKKIKILFILLNLLLIAIIGTLIGISVWANKPRGIYIDLDQLR